MKKNKDPFTKERLDDIREKLKVQAKLHDTSAWNDRFLLRVIDELNREIRRLKTQLARKI